MTIYGAITAMHDKLAASLVACELDSYAKIVPPVALIEIDRSEVIEAMSSGEPYKETHVATIMCIISAQNKTYATFKDEAIAYGNTVMASLHATTGVTVVEKSKAYGEMMIDSLKCSAVTYEVELYF